MGKWFLTDYSATVGRTLMIFLADRPEISIPMECQKKFGPLARLRARQVLRLTQKVGQ